MTESERGNTVAEKGVSESDGENGKKKVFFQWLCKLHNQPSEVI